MIPTLNQVYSDTRVVLEDVDEAGGGAGQRFTDTLLRPFLQTAWSEIYSAALAHNLLLLQRTVYHILPAYTGDLYPSVARIANMGEPISLAERSFDAANSVPITACVVTPVTGIAIVTCGGGHPFLSGQRITHAQIAGLSDDINDSWLVERISATQYYARGTTASGTYTTGGIATYSATGFSKISGPADQSTWPITASPGTALQYWRWENDRFIFPGATVARQLAITFRVSDSLPTQGNAALGIDGCLPYLKHRVAGLAIEGIAPQTAKVHNTTALGPTLETVDLKGLLGSLIRPQVRSGQRKPVQRPPYRPRRMTGPARWGGLV